jgi:hypothetical protein
MKIIEQPGVVAAGLLILQLALVARAQTITPRPHGTAMAQAAMERSPDSRNGLPSGDPAGRGTIQPGKADDTGDPALGGERHPLYRLSQLDVVDIHFALSPEFNQVLPVQPDGFISLRSAESVFAEGLSLPELRLAIVRAYAGILHEPEITISLKDWQRAFAC